MATFLITWNSSSETWPSFSRDAAVVSAGRKFVFNDWPIGHSKHLSKGDRVFVLKQSVAPIGIIGSGHANSDWFPVRPGGPKQRKRTKNAIEIRLDSIFDSDIEDILDRESLLAAGIDWLPFDTRTGGIRIEDWQAEKLEKLWSRFLGGNLPSTYLGPTAEVPAIEGFPEYSLRRHLRRETWKRKEKIDSVLKASGRLICEVPGCNFDYVEKYGLVAKRYAHVHHNQRLADASPVAETRLRDLSIVCASCHAMIHLGGKNRSMKTLILKQWIAHKKK